MRQAENDNNLQLYFFSSFTQKQFSAVNKQGVNGVMKTEKGLIIEYFLMLYYAKCEILQGIEQVPE